MKDMIPRKEAEDLINSIADQRNTAHNDAAQIKAAYAKTLRELDDIRKENAELKTQIAALTMATGT